MDRDQIEELINEKIRQHEIRVALVSGILGLVLMAGTFHAIRLASL